MQEASKTYYRRQAGNSSSHPLFLNLKLGGYSELLRLRVHPAKEPFKFIVDSDDATLFKDVVLRVAKHAFKPKDRALEILNGYFDGSNALIREVEVNRDGEAVISLYVNETMKFSSSDSCRVATPWLSFKEGEGSGWYVQNEDGFTKVSKLWPEAKSARKATGQTSVPKKATIQAPISNADMKPLGKLAPTTEPKDTIGAAGKGGHVLV